MRDVFILFLQHIRIAELAKEDGERKFSSFDRLLKVEALYEAFKNLRKDASAGVDRVTYAEYATEVWKNLQDLHGRRQRYWAGRGCGPYNADTRPGL
jgi:hypothetical protein